jgi:nucleotide-binding universal stress UspA family protein
MIAARDASRAKESSMLKQILLGLDDTPASTRAKEIATSLARTHKAGVTGLAVIDEARIAAPEPIPMGGDSYKQHKDATIIRRTRDQIVALTQRFAHECHAAQINCDTIVSHGDAIDAFVAASDIHDLIVIGRDATFHAPASGRISHIVESLLRQNPRPLIVAPEEKEGAEHILVAYDGSVPAMRALQMFALLGIAGKGEVTVAAVHAQRATAEALSGRAVQYLNAHSIGARSRAVESGAEPADILIEIATELDARLIVMGTYGRRGWREFLLGSTTDKLLSESKSPLFIHH